MKDELFFIGIILAGIGCYGWFIYVQQVSFRDIASIQAISVFLIIVGILISLAGLKEK